MNVTLRSNLQERIQEKVRRGDYPSAEELVEDAVERLLADEEEAERLDTLLSEDGVALEVESADDVRAGIRRGLDDVEAGRTISLDEFDRQMRSKHDIPR